MPGATVLINSNLSSINQNDLESQINSMLSPDSSGNVSFNLNSLGNMFTNSLAGINSNQSNTDQSYTEIFPTKFNNDLKNIKNCFYLVLVSLIIMTLLYLFKSRDIIFEVLSKGLFITSFKYPVMPMFSLLFNLSLIIYFMYKLFHKSLDKVSKKYQNSIEYKNKEHLFPKSSWKDVSDICHTNLENLVQEMHSNFENTDIGQHFQNPIKELSKNINDKRNIIKEIEKKNKINLDLWKKINHDLKQSFSQAYQKFKQKEKQLLEIKSKIIDIKEWCSKTESLLGKYNDKGDVEEIVKKYVKNKIADLDYPQIVKEYQESYLDLKAILNYLSHNHQLENISKCPVCLTNIKNSFYVSCGHCFCEDCIEEQHKVNKKYMCPICREKSTKIGKLFS
jgi:hypothetical protein